MVDVADGDTVTLSGVGSTRLIGVDTPEVFGGAECGGAEASAFTKRVLDEGHDVLYRLGREPRDRYGRALAYVWLTDDRLFNGLLVERGLAVPLAIPPNTRLAPRFRAAARRARRADRGLWSPRTCDGSADRPVGGGPATPRGPAAGGRSPDGPGAGRPTGDRDCGDFATRDEAQRYFESRGGGPGRDVDRLDSDGDGEVCESLP